MAAASSTVEYCMSDRFAFLLPPTTMAHAVLCGSRLVHSLAGFRDQFAPFLLPEDEDEDPGEHFEKYCFALETTAVWGGHLEITALADVLQRQINVYAVGMTPIKVGEQYSGEGKPSPLELCYLRHAFGLGEHYNSTKKLLFAVDDYDADEGDGDDEGEEASGTASSQGGEAAAATAAAANGQQS
jgi:OTU domain-containing protein 6